MSLAGEISVVGWDLDVLQECPGWQAVSQLAGTPIHCSVTKCGQL